MFSNISLRNKLNKSDDIYISLTLTRIGVIINLEWRRCTYVMHDNIKIDADVNHMTRQQFIVKNKSFLIDYEHIKGKKGI